MVIHDNTALRRYELDVDGVTAFMTYRRKDGVITILHTEVPERVSGRGVGSALARGVLDRVRREGVKFIVECPFLSAFIASHPEYRDLQTEHQTEHDGLDARLDEALDETFPASDSPAVTPRH
jgi:predicted GNAT family acetyltransferase